MPEPSSTAGPSVDASVAAAGSTTATATVAATTLATAAAGPLQSGESMELAAGPTGDGVTWLPAFRMTRRSVDTDESYLAAQAGCGARNMALCTDSQWQRACRSRPAIASVPTWTATGSTKGGFVVRGGGQGCSAERIVAPATHDAGRAGFCCTRVVGVRGDAALRQRAADKLLRVEKAFTVGPSELIESLVAETVEYRGETLVREVFVRRDGKMFQLEPAGWILHDVCDVTATSTEQGWTADCNCVVQQGRLLGHWMRRYVFSASGHITSLDVPKVFRAAAAP
jgi:hypothetical protein